MRLLIVTQKVQANDAILGFFHDWLLEFSKQTEKVIVIAQSVNDESLPKNVFLESLGKEKKKKLRQQVWKFWGLILKQRKEYDVVLVHMTPIWIVLGAPFWFVLRKPMFLWYEARGIRWPLRVALAFVKKAFSASEYGMPLPSKKGVVVGHGIDTESFVPDPTTHREKLVVTVGRITAAKRMDIIFQCFARFPKNYSLIIAGSTLTAGDENTLRELQRLMQQNHFAERVQLGFLSRSQVLSLYQRAEIFLHASVSGLDKSLLEAMSCGCLVVSTSPAMEEVLPVECRATDETMYDVAMRLMDLPAREQSALRKDLRSIVERDHSLPRLIEVLIEQMGMK